jgi:hypothetical protein
MTCAKLLTLGALRDREGVYWTGERSNTAAKRTTRHSKTRKVGERTHAKYI